jgi:hypothetical protein
MIDEVKKILSHSSGEVIADPELCFSLIKCYSRLYKVGCSVRTCKNSLYLYYKILQKNGIEMATINEQAKERTCVPAFKGIKYISRAAKYFNADLLTDRDAIFLLQHKCLTEEDFIKLPTGWNTGQENCIKSPTGWNTGQENCILEIADLLAQGMSVKAIKEKYKDVKEIGGKKCTKELWTELIKEARKLNEVSK